MATLPCHASAACCMLRFNAWSASLVPTAMTMVLVSGNSAMACASVPGKSTFAFCCQMDAGLPAGKALPEVLIASTGTPRASGARSDSKKSSAGCCMAMIRSALRPIILVYLKSNKSRISLRSAGSPWVFRFRCSTMMSSLARPAAAMAAT